MVRFLRAEMNVMCVHQSLNISKQLHAEAEICGGRAKEKLRLLRTQTTFIRDYHCMSHTLEKRTTKKQAQEKEREKKIRRIFPTVLISVARFCIQGIQLLMMLPAHFGFVFFSHCAFPSTPNLPSSPF